MRLFLLVIPVLLVNANEDGRDNETILEAAVKNNVDKMKAAIDTFKKTHNSSNPAVKENLTLSDFYNATIDKVLKMKYDDGLITYVEEAEKDLSLLGIKSEELLNFTTITSLHDFLYNPDYDTFGIKIYTIAHLLRFAVVEVLNQTAFSNETVNTPVNMTLFSNSTENEPINQTYFANLTMNLNLTDYLQSNDGSGLALNKTTDCVVNDVITISNNSEASCSNPDNAEKETTTSTSTSSSTSSTTRSSSSTSTTTTTAELTSSASTDSMNENMSSISSSTSSSTTTRTTPTSETTNISRSETSDSRSSDSMSSSSTETKTTTNC